MDSADIVENRKIDFGEVNSQRFHFGRLVLPIMLASVIFFAFFVLHVETGFGAEAASQGKIVISDSKITQGETFDVTVEIYNNPGITSLDCYVTYDTDCMQLVSRKNGSLLGGAVYSQKLTDYPYYCGWINALQTKDTVENGTLITLTFKVKNTAKDGLYEIGIKNGQAIGYSAALDKKVFQVKAGTVQVGSAQNGSTQAGTGAAANPAQGAQGAAGEGTGQGQEDGKGEDSETGTVGEDGQGETEESTETVSPLAEKVKAMSVTISSPNYNKKKNTITIEYKKSNSKIKISKYQIWRSTKKNGTYRKIFTTKKLTYTDKKINSKVKTYYYKVRGVRTVDGKTVYTKWSKKVKVKVSD